ncbi:MAG: SRPBCC family protein [Verrucomicrobia bacterium]|nr:SRPBCC family protein [Verrucomicrobiota bacterium]
MSSSDRTGTSEFGNAKTITKGIEIGAPIRVVYNQWTQFEDFPRFLEGVEEVRQIDPKNLHWRAKIGGKSKEWDARITQQIPDQKIAWESVSGAPNGGSVNFTSIANEKTQVTLTLVYEPEGMMEQTGDALGLLESRIEGDLERFRDFIESRARETGHWRGRVVS